MIALLDTCALIWWTVDPAKLSRKAAEICGRIDTEGCAISSISIWEIGTKIKKGKLDIGLSIEEFAARLRRAGTITIVPIDENIWISNLKLNWAHADPADRTVVATAMHLSLPIVTADAEMSAFFSNTIW